MLDLRKRPRRLCRTPGTRAMVRETSLCGLGQTAPNPVLSTLRYFRHEYEALLQKHGPAHNGRVPLRP